MKCQNSNFEQNEKLRIYTATSRATTKTLTQVGKAKNLIARVRYASCKYSNNPKKVGKEEERNDNNKTVTKNRGDKKQTTKQRPIYNYINNFTKC